MANKKHNDNDATGIDITRRGISPGEEAATLEARRAERSELSSHPNRLCRTTAGSGRGPAHGNIPAIGSCRPPSPPSACAGTRGGVVDCDLVSSVDVVVAVRVVLVVAAAAVPATMTEDLLRPLRFLRVAAAIFLQWRRGSYRQQGLLRAQRWRSPPRGCSDRDCAGARRLGDEALPLERVALLSLLCDASPNEANKPKT